MHSVNLEDFSIKLTKIMEYLSENKYSSMILTRQENFSWLSSGGNSKVIFNDESFGIFVITGNDVFLIAHIMDGHRLLDEELSNINSITYIPLKWHEKSRVEKALSIAGNNPCSDVYIPNTDMVLNDIYDMHFPLTNNEIEKLKYLGKTTEEVFYKIALQIKPNMSDYEVEALFLYEYAKLNIQCDVCLIASDERIFNYRHPSPVGKKIGKYVLLHTVARYKGLHANVTRNLYFGNKLPSEIERPFNLVSEINANCLSNSVPGKKWIDILKMQKDILQKYGYESEWENHFPGGRTGYFVCQANLSLDKNKVLLENEPYDWFITVKGAKVEELSINENGKFNILSMNNKWATKDFRTIDNQVVKLPNILLL